MTSLLVLTLAGSLFSVATPTATYPHPAARASQPMQTARLTRQWVADGRGQVWRPEVAPANAPAAPATPAARPPQVHTFASLGK
jgi:hypothetical protein